MERAAQHLTWQSPPDAASLGADRAAPARLGIGALVVVLAFVPLWLPGPLLLGEFSLAFLVPAGLALWGLARPGRPGAIGRAMHGNGGRGLWLEALSVVTILTMAALSTIYSPEPQRAFRVILPMSYAVCALILLARAPPVLRFQLVRGVLYSGALVLALALLLTQTGAGRPLVMRDYRFLAFFENPNQLGVAFLAVWPLSLALLINARSVRGRLLHGAIALVLAGAILMSGTKTALALGFVSGASVWLYHGMRTGSIGIMIARLIMTLCALALAVPALLWLLSWISPLFFDRVETILTNGVWSFTSMQTRGAIWQESIATGLAHPLLGAGAGTGVYGYSHSHNMLLDYFRGMGIFALAGATLLVLSTMARGATFIAATWRKGPFDRRPDLVVASLYLGAIFYLAGNMLSDSFSPTTSFLFWMTYVGACLATAPNAVARRAAHRSTTSWAPRTKRLSAHPDSALPAV